MFFFFFFFLSSTRERRRDERTNERTNDDDARNRRRHQRKNENASASSSLFRVIRVLRERNEETFSKFPHFPNNKSASSSSSLHLARAHTHIRSSVALERHRKRDIYKKKEHKMSDVYSLEPPTKGKVILETTFGDIDIELFASECPLACRAFVRLCVDGYYEQNVFHRILKDFMVQTGDKSGSGHGSGVEKKFKDEFHSRIKFNKRGQVAMANEGKRDSNGASFVETMFFFLRFARCFLLLCSVRAWRFILSLSFERVQLIDRVYSPTSVNRFFTRFRFAIFHHAQRVSTFGSEAHDFRESCRPDVL